MKNPFPLIFCFQLIIIFLIVQSNYLLHAFNNNNNNNNTTNGHAERFQNVMKKARLKAFEGGLYGASAGSIQVLTLMWLRTTVNYQYRYGVSFKIALQQLYLQGGITRFYRGLSYALIQGPLSKFGSVAANEGSKVLIHYYSGSENSYFLTSALGSVLSIIWRLFLMPVDTCKTVLQVEGAKGFNLLWKRLLQGDIGVLYQGSIATMLSTFAGHYPWFFVHNLLDNTIKESPSNNTVHNVIRSASIGFIASAVSDTVSNFIRVIKTVKQSIISVDNLSYIQVINKIYNEGGLYSLFFRGLITRIFANGLQSMVFTVLWKLLPNLENNLRNNKT